MKKRFLCAVLATLLTLSSVMASAATVTMYAQDGRTTEVDSSKVAAYKKVGWYEGVTMYAADGRSKVVSPFRVAAEKKVGWYEGVKMYSLTGEESFVSPFEMGDYKLLGWETDVTMFAKDGRSKKVSPFKVEAEKKVGWYEGVVMFALDGRSKIISPFKVEAYKKVGWYVLDDYIATLIKTKGYEAAIAGLEDQFEEIDTETFITYATNLLDSYYKKIGCPIAVLSWSKHYDEEENEPYVTIVFRNVSPKEITYYEHEITCYDSKGKVTSDLSYYNGTISCYSYDNHETGEVFSASWSLEDNTKTASISWPKITTVQFTDGTIWER